MTCPCAQPRMTITRETMRMRIDSLMDLFDPFERFGPFDPPFWKYPDEYEDEL